MSTVFTRPTLPHGTLPITNWAYNEVGEYANWTAWTTEELVDAEILQRNWAILYSHINGNLNGTDLNVDGASINESSVVQGWAGTSDHDPDEAWPTASYRHSHDGMDSSFLADNVISSTVLDDGHLIIRSPSKSYHSLALHSRGYSVRGIDSIPETEVAFPLNSKRWPRLIRADATLYTKGYFHLIASSYVANWSTLTLAAKRSLCVPCIRTISGDITGMVLEQPRNTICDLSDDARVPDVLFQTLGVFLNRSEVV